MKTARYAIAPGTEVTLAGNRLVISGVNDLGYQSMDLESGAMRVIPFQTFIDYMNLPGAKLDVNLPLSGNRVQERLGGHVSSKSLSDAQQRDASFHVAICKAMTLVRDQMRQKMGNSSFELSIRKAKAQRPAIASIVEGLTGEKIYLKPPRGGATKSGRRYLYQGRKLVDMFGVYNGLEKEESAHDALAPLDHLKGNRVPRIPDRTRQLMTQSWEHVGLDTKAPSPANVRRHLEMLIREENTFRQRNQLAPLVVPSQATLSAHRAQIIGDTAYLFATMGDRHSMKERGRGSTDIRALVIGEYVEIDECKASLVTSAKACGLWETLNTNDREILGRIDEEIRERLHILVMLDIASRMPLGWIISDHPKAEATLALVRMATRSKAREARKFGCVGEPLPAIGLGHIRNDNGTGLRNSAVIGAALGIGGTNSISRAYSPNERPYIERMFGTQESVLLKLIHGYTGRKPGELPGYDAVKNGVLDVQTLMGILTRFMIDEYPAMRHHGVGMGGRRPIEVWKEINETRGCFMPLDPDRRRIHLGWEQKSTPTDEGVRVFTGIWFNSPELQAKLEETGHRGKVLVFVDPDNLNCATVIIPKVQKPITVDLQITAFADMTLPEVLELMEIWRNEDGMLAEVYEDRLATVRRKNFDKLLDIGVEKKLSRSYSTLEECSKKAEWLFAGTRIIRNTHIEGTTPAGHITDFSSEVGAIPIAGPDMLIDGLAHEVEPEAAASGEEGAVLRVGGDLTDEPSHAQERRISARPPKAQSPAKKPKKPKPAAAVLGRPETLRKFE